MELTKTKHQRLNFEDGQNKVIHFLINFVYIIKVIKKLNRIYLQKNFTQYQENNLSTNDEFNEDGFINKNGRIYKGRDEVSVNSSNRNSNNCNSTLKIMFFIFIVLVHKLEKNLLPSSSNISNIYSGTFKSQ